MFWNNFYSLCLSRGIKPAQVGRDLGIASGSLTKWKNGTIPHKNSMKKLADYFNVSVEYFFISHAAETNNTKERSQEEELKIALFGGDGEVTDEMWEDVKKYAEFIKAKYKK